MSIFDDINLSPEALAEIEAATLALTQFPAPDGWSLLGLLPPRLFFGDSWKAVGRLPRWLADTPQHRNAFITRGHLFSAVSLAAETVMRKAEEQSAVLTLAGLVERLAAQGHRWAEEDMKPGYSAAAEFAFTVAGLWQITTPDPGQGAFERRSFNQYIQRVPIRVRDAVSRRLQGLYEDKTTMPCGSYQRSDLMRRFCRAKYALSHIRDNIALVDNFVESKPHLVIDDHDAWDILYTTLKEDSDLHALLKAFGQFYLLLTGAANAPSALDYLNGYMDLGRESAAIYAAEYDLPLIQLDSVGLGRSLLPAQTNLLTRVADRIRQYELPNRQDYTASTFGQLMRADRLVLGTRYTWGMIGGPSGASFLDRLLVACEDTFANREAPDTRDLVDFMAVAIGGLSHAEPVRTISHRQFGGDTPDVRPGLHIDSRINSVLINTLAEALQMMRQVVKELGEVTGSNVDMGNVDPLLKALPVLHDIVSSPDPVRPWFPAFDQLAPFDLACEPKTAGIYSIEQEDDKPNLWMNWMTVPALVEQVFQYTDNGEPVEVKARGVTMISFQGIIPRTLRDTEIPELYWPVVMDSDALLGNIEAQPEMRVRFHRSLIAGR